MANILNRQHYHKGDRIFAPATVRPRRFLSRPDRWISSSGRVTLKRSSVRSAPVRSLARWRCLTTRLDQRPRLLGESTTCVLITRTDFQKRVDKSDAFIRALLMLMTKRLRETTSAQGKAD